MLAGREESTTSNEDSDSPSSGTYEGVAECRRGGMAVDVSVRRKPSHGVWLPLWLGRRATALRSSSILASLSSIRSIFFSLHGNNYAGTDVSCTHPWLVRDTILEVVGMRREGHEGAGNQGRKR